MSADMKETKQKIEETKISKDNRSAINAEDTCSPKEGQNIRELNISTYAMLAGLTTLQKKSLKLDFLVGKPSSETLEMATQIYDHFLSTKGEKVAESIMSDLLGEEYPSMISNIQVKIKVKVAHQEANRSKNKLFSFALHKQSTNTTNNTDLNKAETTNSSKNMTVYY